MLEWQDAVWLVQRNQDEPCSPVNLLEQGRKLGSGHVANVTFAKNHAYIGLKNGAFYAVDTQSGETGLRLELNTSAFVPTRVAGNGLIIQVGNELRAFGLP